MEITKINNEISLYNKKCRMLEDTFTTRQKNLFYKAEAFVESLSNEQMKLFIDICKIINPTEN